jgi:hypothetical protein
MRAIPLVPTCETSILVSKHTSTQWFLYALNLFFAQIWVFGPTKLL